MTSIVRPASPHSSHVIPPNKKFRTVLGFGPLFKDTDPRPTFTRNSADTARSYSYHKKPRPSIASSTFFRPQQGNIQSQNTPAVDPAPSENMTVESAVHSHPARRPPMRMDTQDGPWSVSVAETPHDARSYSLYIKTPTHNLTLTRTAMEIVELDHKLRDAHPATSIPALPIDALTLPAPPPKRKSTFLNTLSRLASPTAKSGRSAARRATNSSISISTNATPLTSPSGELGDPFTSFATNAEGEEAPAPSKNSTGVAAYLTTVSNTAALRQARVWKRFVRVRTDDLESVRVERAIKRVRSDVAAHVGLDKEKEKEPPAVESTDPSAAPSETASVANEEVAPNGSAHATAVDLTGDAPETHSIPEADVEFIAKALDQAEAEEEANKEERKEEENITTKETITTKAKASDVPPSPAAEQPPPPTPTELPARMQRSQSADPDKSSRISRAFASSTPTPTDTASQTEDESSVSTTSARKKTKRTRARSSDGAPKEARRSQRKVVIDDFEMMRVLGKGCAGKVLLVKHKSTTDLYALKAITKRHVLAHQELQHTLTEQAVLKRMAAESKDPFVVKLWWSFHDKENLFLVMDFHPGGDLATQLARWGRLGRDRARFYAAEIVEGVEGLHAAGVIYRDLKPENILIGADGHIVLTDFGLSKEFPRRTTAITAPSTPSASRTEFYAPPASPGGAGVPATPPWMRAEKGGEVASGWPGQPVGQSDATSTFCGTAEYLAPEVIQGLPYSYEVDWWSFGTMLYEMLTGITPFWANNHSDMYVRVLQDELQFPDDRAIDQDTKSLIRGLLQRNPGLRMCEPRIKRHPYFSMIDWSHVYYKRYIPPYIPPIDPSNASDTQNFDDTFLDMEPVLDEFTEADQEQADTDQEPEHAGTGTDTDRTGTGTGTGTDGEDSNTTPSQSRSSSIRPQLQPTPDELVDVFDGYSFKGRHSVLIDGDSEEEEESASEEDEGGILGELEAETLMVAELEKPQVDAGANVDANVDAAPLEVEEEVQEPKTPEARPVVTLDIPEPVTELDVPADEPDTPAAVPPTPAPAPVVEPPLPAPPTPVEATPRKSKDLPAPTVQDTAAPILPEKTLPLKAIPRPANGRAARPRREKSGVPALDKYLSDHADEDANLTEREDDEDDDWDIVEAVDGEDRNGAKGTSLFARGVVDRYRLAVFRKASTPTQRTRPVPRSVSGMSKDSEVTVSETATESPSPTQRRGRNPGLGGFRKQRQFLGPKTPPSSFSSKSSRTAKSMSQSQSQSGSNTLSAASTASSGGFLTPSPSLGGTGPESPSLKSKESAISVGTRSMSSDQSGSPPAPERERGKGPVQTQTHQNQNHEEPEKNKNRKLKKYKENAEKVFSLFSSPRQPS